MTRMLTAPEGLTRKHRSARRLHREDLWRLQQLQALPQALLQPLAQVGGAAKAAHQQHLSTAVEGELSQHR